MSLYIKAQRVRYNLTLPLLSRSSPQPARRQPLFVIGSGRSGNTLLRRVLLASSQIHIPPETYVLGPLIEGWPRMALLPWKQRVWLFCAHFEKHNHFPTFCLDNLNDFARAAEQLQPQTLKALIDAFYMHLARTEGSAASRWGDKTPWNTYHLPALGAMFPQARYVWLTRDGRDVALSYVKAGLYDSLDEAAARWGDANRACHQFERWCPHMYRLRYEDLVTTPHESFAALFDWADLEFDAEMLERQPEAMGDVEQESHHAQVRQKISARSVGNWRDQLDPSRLSALPRGFKTQLQVLGYGD